MRLAPGWQPWVLTPFLLALALVPLAWLLAYGWTIPASLACLGLVTTWFFRDPDRAIGDEIVAAADGTIKTVQPEAIVTFLNVHNVHVVRAPYAGRVDTIHRFDGPRQPAFLEDAKHNAGLALTLATDWGHHDIHLMAGLVARQAVAFVEEGDVVAKGDRIGMIRFGSRVDVDLPPGAEPLVEPGQRAWAGQTRIATEPKSEAGVRR